MRYISFVEIEPRSSLPSFAGAIEDTDYPNKEKILQFLKNGKVEDLAKVSRSRDYFTKKFIPEESLLLSHGDFYWPSELIWYVDKYNLRLPEDFEQYILQNS